MPYPKNNYFQKKRKSFGPRANQRIFVSEVQVISSDGNNLGVMPTKSAIEMARKEGLDLVEISSSVRPPVCKIIDLGKYKYDLQKKANRAKKKQKVVNLKEIKLRPVTEVHDYNFKLKNAQKFLTKGDKVKFTVKFRGREMQHTQLGDDLLKRVLNDIKEVGKVELKPQFEGRQMIMIIQPV